MTDSPPSSRGGDGWGTHEEDHIAFMLVIACHVHSPGIGHAQHTILRQWKAIDMLSQTNQDKIRAALKLHCSMTGPSRVSRLHKDSFGNLLR